MLIGELGEEALLRQLRSLFAVTSTGVPVGVGDDAAVIDIPDGHQMVWSTDILVEAIHFRTDWQPARTLGRKCLAVNISDIISMGALPHYALLTLSLSPATEVEYILELCQGFCDLAMEVGVAVIGGDTSASPAGMTISVTAGGLVPEGRAVLRSGASPGDAILVIGYLGSASGGLKLLEGNVSPRDYPGLLAAFLDPACLLGESRAAAAAGATAMTDVSDGLSTDLAHICQESGAGARIFLDRLPVHPDLPRAAERLGWDGEAMLLGGGEDYSLLLTVPPAAADDAVKKISESSDAPVTMIGEIEAGGGIVLVAGDGSETPLAEQGFDHFTRSGDRG